jgi:two-component system chemotaxis response regulator CheB
VLTGSLDDGTAGLYSIKTHGGVSIVQDPADAAHSGMPSSALQIVEPTYVLDLASIGTKIAEVVRRSAHEPRVPGANDLRRTTAATGETSNGLPTQLSCPECNGPLVDLHDANLTRYRCHTGHSFSPESLFADQTEHLERTLWNALRALDESAQVARRLEGRAVAAQRAALALRYQERAAEAQQGVELIKEVLRQRARVD